MDTVDSDRESARLAAEHYENFPVGSWLLPRRLRPHVHRLYAFARIADDLADEAQDLAALRAYRAETARALAGEQDGVRPLLQRAHETALEFSLDPLLFFDLLDAFERDLTQKRYATLAELHDYCRQSALPIGRAMLGIFGRASPENLADSDRICAALQILNHCQDVRSDYVERGRIYLPADRLRHHGVQEPELAGAQASEGLRRVLEELGTECATAFRESWPLARRVGGRLGLELNAILHGAGLVLRRLRNDSFDSLRSRPRIRRLDAPGLLLRAMFQWSSPSLL